MKCELKGSVNMKIQGGETVELSEVLYVHQAVKNLLSVSRLVSKAATMGATQEKITIKKNGVSMILDSREGGNDRTVLYFKAKLYALERQ